jgi:hypothetical protein
MSHYQTATLAELVAMSVPDSPNVVNITTKINCDAAMPETLAELVAQSTPDEPSDLVLRNYPYQTKTAQIGFTERRLREGNCILGWVISYE